VVEGAPAKLVFETLHLPYALKPPARGSVLNVFTFPPDEGKGDAAAYFRSMGCPEASVSGPHPYMQRLRTLDFCIVLEGELVLVLDTEEVKVKAGDFVIQRGTSHAWSNRSGKPAVVAIAAHGAR